jgi:hypothetical protein
MALGMAVALPLRNGFAIYLRSSTVRRTNSVLRRADYHWPWSTPKPSLALMSLKKYPDPFVWS